MRKLRREVQVPIYWLVVGMAVMLLSPVLSIMASVKLVERRDAQQAEVSRVSACQFMDIWLRTFDETPPPSASGKNLQKELTYQYNLAHCQPTRK